MKTALELSQKLIDSNTAARRVLGDKYEETALPWRQALRAIMGATGEDIAHATLRAMQAARGSSDALMISAAAVDLMREEA